jgi:predicted dehydrogenase
MTRAPSAPEAGLVVGYGSIGRQHAQALGATGLPLAIVDADGGARARAEAAHPGATVVSEVAALDPARLPWMSTAAVIATWGPSHALVFHALADRGVRRILCEKPLASSVADADAMVRRAERDGVRLLVNHTLRYIGLAPALRRLAHAADLGDPVAVVADGGANCLVTNGLHWIDFVIALFGCPPARTAGTARGEPGNPRSSELRLYGGTAVWEFADGREAVLAFSNRSSVDSTTRVYYRDALAEIDLDFNVILRRRDMTAVREAPAVTRTGPACESLHEGALPGARSLPEARLAVIRELVDSAAPTCDGRTGAAAVNACVGALVASREGCAVTLPIGPSSPWGEERWPMS